MMDDGVNLCRKILDCIRLKLIDIHKYGFKKCVELVMYRYAVAEWGGAVPLCPPRHTPP